MNAKDALSIFIVEQNAVPAFDFADQAFLLETGRVVLSGPTEQLRHDATVRRSYLGY